MTQQHQSHHALTPDQERDDNRRNYDVAIRAMRLAGIRRGEFEPNPDDPQEVQAARLAKVAA